MAAHVWRQRYRTIMSDVQSTYTNAVFEFRARRNLTTPSVKNEEKSVSESSDDSGMQFPIMQYWSVPLPSRWFTI